MCDFEANSFSAQSHFFFLSVKWTLIGPSHSTIIELCNVEFKLLLAFRSYYQKSSFNGKKCTDLVERCVHEVWVPNSLTPLVGLTLLLLSRIWETKWGLRKRQVRVIKTSPARQVWVVGWYYWSQQSWVKSQISILIIASYLISKASIFSFNQIKF